MSCSFSLNIKSKFESSHFSFFPAATWYIILIFLMCIIVSFHSFSCFRCPDFEESMLVHTYIHILLHRETLKHIVRDVISVWLLTHVVLCMNYILCVL